MLVKVRGGIVRILTFFEVHLFQSFEESNIFLAHLSKDNNSPELAYLTAQSALTEAGMREDMDFVLRVAPRTDLEPVMVF